MLLSYQAIQIPSKFRNIYDYLLTVYDTSSSRAKRVFCTDTFRLTIRKWCAGDVYATIDDVTTPYEPLFVTISVIVWFQNLSKCENLQNLPTLMAFLPVPFSL